MIVNRTVLLYTSYYINDANMFIWISFEFAVPLYEKDALEYGYIQ